MFSNTGSFSFNTASFEINLINNKIRFKDDRMEYAVNVILNESVKAGFPDFNSDEKEMLMVNLKLLVL